MTDVATPCSCSHHQQRRAKLVTKKKKALPATRRAGRASLHLFVLFPFSPRKPRKPDSLLSLELDRQLDPDLHGLVPIQRAGEFGRARDGESGLIEGRVT